MKQKRVSLLAFVLALSVLIFACRKLSNFVYTDSPSSTVLDAAKLWHTQQTQGQNPKRMLRPRWSQSWSITLSNGSSALIVPAKERTISNAHRTVRRFFVFKIQDNAVQSGNIVELLGVDYNVSDKLETLLPKLEGGKIPDFTGAVIKYDIRYRHPTSRVYSKGDIKYGSTYIASKLTPERLNRLIPAPTQSKSKLKPTGGTWVDGYYFDENCTYQIDVVNDEVVGITELNCTDPNESEESSNNGDNSGGASSSSSGGESNPPYGGDPNDNSDCAGVQNGTAFMSPCGCMGGTTGITKCDPKDPCNLILIVNRKLNSPQEVIKQQAALSVTMADPQHKERGWDRRLSAMSDDANQQPLIDFQVRTGGVGTFPWHAEWDTTNGFWVGGGHTHAGDQGPSPDDYFAMGDVLLDPASYLSTRSSGEKDFYKSQVSVVAVSASATYVINVADWQKMDSLRTVFHADTHAFNNTYRAKMATYRSNNLNSNPYLAGAAALMEMCGDAVNILFGDYHNNPSGFGVNIDFMPLRFKSGTPHAQLEKNPCTH